MPVVSFKEIPMVYIIILNWNGLYDTIECLESVFQNDFPNYRVIVCDNNSNDGSLDKIAMWADGVFPFSLPENSPIYNSKLPNIEKPISYKRYTRHDIEVGQNLGGDESLILIQNGENLGFAGGCNVGIQYALLVGDFNYIWLLNNDTVIEQDALSLMVKRIQTSPKAGMCGSMLLDYHDPSLIQALGGATFNKWFAISQPIGALQRRPLIANTGNHKIDHLIGASMLVSKQFLEDVGLMSEDYFLYYEEIDWSIRAQHLYNIIYEPNSIVFHKEGRSIGSSNKPMERSEISDYYGLRNRLIFTRKFFPSALITVYVGLFIAVFNRVRRRQWKRSIMIMRIIFSVFL